MSQIITDQLIRLDKTYKNKNDVIQAMVEDLYMIDRISDKQKFFDSVMERENMCSTEIEFGFAIPHGKSEVVKEPSISFTRLSKDMIWSKEYVKFVVLLSIPEKSGADTHLKIIAAFSRKLMDEEFRKILLTIQDPKQLAEIINKEVKY